MIDNGGRASLQYTVAEGTGVGSFLVISDSDVLIVEEMLDDAFLLRAHDK